MRILSRYIAKTTMLATGLTFLMMTGLVLLLNLLSEFKDIGVGEYVFINGILYVMMRLAGEVYRFSPLILLLGSVVGLSALSSFRELAVMRASGFSIHQILKSVMVAAVAIVIGMVLLGEWLAPYLNYKAEVQKAVARNGGQAVVTSSGLWLHIDNNFIHVKQVVGRELLEGVTRYQFDDKHRLQSAYLAKRLEKIDGEWVMMDVQKTIFLPNERTESKWSPKLAWGLKFNANLFNIGLLDPDEMSLPKLYRFANYLDKNGLQSTQYRYEFWQRVFQPFVSLIMVFLALPFVMSVFSTATLAWRVLTALLVGFVFFILNALFGELSIVYQIPAVLAALVPLMFFASVGIILNKKLTR